MAKKKMMTKLNTKLKNGELILITRPNNIIRISNEKNKETDGKEILISIREILETLMMKKKRWKIKKI